MTYETAIGQSLEEIVTPVRRLLNEGGENNYLVLVSDQERNYYVQVAGMRGGDGVTVEAVSNTFIQAGQALSNAQTGQLASLGWNRPDAEFPNFYRLMDVISDNDYAVIARLLMRTLVEVYGMDRDDLIHFELHLE